MLTLTQIICEAEAGVLYTSPTGHKVMDHGGFGTDERNVALVISNPHVAGANAGKYFSGPDRPLLVGTQPQPAPGRGDRGNQNLHPGNPEPDDVG